jgi:hypothetical protein
MALACGADGGRLSVQPESESTSKKAANGRRNHFSRDQVRTIPIPCLMEMHYASRLSQVASCSQNGVAQRQLCSRRNNHDVIDQAAKKSAAPS